MIKSIIPIRGMHCRSCEILIEEKLKELPEIKSIQVSYKKKQALIYSKHSLDMNTLRKAIAKAGYEVGIDDKKHWISRDPEQYKDLGLALAILLTLYFWAKILGLGSINLGGTKNPSNLLVVLVVGLTAGISTCMALVGGLVLGISARHAEKHSEASSSQKFRPHLFFNIGRISSYFLLGGIIGLIGKAFQLNGPTLGILTIVVGIVMLIMGFQLTELFPRLSNGGLTLPVGISKFLGIKKHHDKEYSHGNSVLVGALTFFLPCGFTQAMQLYAMSTGSFWSGALIMGTFALGTAPGLLGIGGLTSLLKGSFAKKFFKFAGVLVISLAILNISNGYNLTGWKNVFAFKSKSSASINDPNVKIEGGMQVVRMTQSAYGYKPNKFTIKKSLPVRWIINSTDQSSCASSILAPKINIRKSLKQGDNIIDFNPKDTGDIKFSCSMGMYTGKFTVVDDQTQATPPEKVGYKKPAESQPTPAATKDTTENNVPGPTPSTVKGTDTKVPAVSKSEAQVNSTPTPTVQNLNTVFASIYSDIVPNEFTVKSGIPVHLEVEVKTDGEGCMSSIMIPGLADQPEILTKGETLKFDFTPEKPGTYDITCAMGVPRGKLIVT